MKAIFIILLFSFCYNVSVAQVNTSSLVYERAAGAVVLIETGAKFGSGFFVSKDGWIVTNKHVIEKESGGIANSKLKDELKNIVAEIMEKRRNAVDNISIGYDEILSMPDEVIKEVSFLRRQVEQLTNIINNLSTKTS